MRIIAGKFARNALVAPTGLATRPTADRAREALFNILQHQDWGKEALVGALVLDVCAGTGALGLEALSRGAAAITFMESEPAAIAAIKQNIAALGVQSLCKILRGDAAAPPRAGQGCNLLFCDPPYHQGWPEKIIPALIAHGWVAPDALLALETARDEKPTLPPQFRPQLVRNYGVANISIWRFVNIT